MQRFFLITICLLGLLGVAWLGAWSVSESPKHTSWREIVPGVWRSPGSPATHALISGDKAILFDASASPEPLRDKGVKRFEAVLLTHAHRDGLWAIDSYTAMKTPIRAAKAAAPWLTREGVSQFWKESIPLRSSRTAYLVIPEGIAGIDCSLVPDQVIEFGEWSIRVIAAPGPSPEHVAYLATRKSDRRRILFAGDALAEPGKLWSPWTTDWDHWTDVGLVPSAKTLRDLAALTPDVLLPQHGEPLVAKGDSLARDLKRTASAVDEMGFLKSYERYTRERRKDPPKYEFLAKEQAGSNGSKPWSRLSKSLWLTGNTYVLASKEGPYLVVDPWDPHSEKQIPKLQKEEKLGKVEVVLASHAHYDHYDGAYVLQTRDKPQVWTLDVVAGPIAEPFKLRAPFLDARALTIDKRLKDRESIRWREYTLKFHFLPGQTLFTCGIETTIDGKKCLFTADNFFHHDLYSGTGGWMGLNFSGPSLYETAARRVAEIAPDWVLAEHGSAMEYNAEDFQRRIAWGREGAKAADALCVSGKHEHDWSPHRVRIEPMMQSAKAGETMRAELVVENRLACGRKIQAALIGRDGLESETWTIEVAANTTLRKAIEIRVKKTIPVGRHVFEVRVKEGEQVEPCDCVVAVEVK
jgi:glyoxylase-like metal-dependent hydrolase (beta-lactamase superfamily II)